jgi:hypothetical protein
MRIKFFILTIAIIASSCKKKKNEPAPNNPGDPHPQELITTCEIHVRDSANGAIVLNSPFIFRDADGDGGNAPTRFDTIKLSPNNTYLVDIVLLDESKTPTDTISNEVLEEANDHQFFFHPSSGSNTVINYEDLDGNNLPIGLQSKWKTNAMPASPGNIQIVLKHQPGAKNGSEPPGDTDMDLNFVLKIQ